MPGCGISGSGGGGAARLDAATVGLAVKEIDASAVPGLLRSGMRVFVAGSTNEPQGLVDAIGRQAACASGVTFLQFPLPGLNRTDFSALHPQADMVAFFLTPALRDGHGAGRVRYLPMHMRNVFDYLRATDLDVALIQVARDRRGDLRLGPNADFYDAVAQRAARCRIVAELNHGFVAPAGAPRIESSAIDYVVESDRPVPTLAPPVLDPTARAIGRRVAELIRDGDCIQTGIGAIPAAILAALGDKNDLGMHGGLIDDGGLALVDQGVLTGRAKTHRRGRHVAGMAIGSASLLDRLAERPDVVLAAADVTHDVRVLARIDNFVSINSAVEVDLHGQVNAEAVAGRQISGTGGAVDFMRGARLSRGGRSIVAMTATARRGQRVSDRSSRRPGDGVAHRRGSGGDGVRRGEAAWRRRGGPGAGAHPHRTPRLS